MVTIDPTAWLAPDLRIELGGHTYVVRPPSVDRARQIVALVARAEISLGLTDAVLSEALASVVDEIAEDELGWVTLGRDVWDQMVADDVPGTHIDRMAYYAMWFWARGKGMADWVITTLWVDRSDDVEVSADPKASTPATRPHGRRTASVNPTPTAGTPTTAESPTT